MMLIDTHNLVISVSLRLLGVDILIISSYIEIKMETQKVM